MLQKGDMAPDFALTSSSGDTVRLSDFRGQRVILFFYPRAATPGCTRQACGFRDRWEIINAAGATVLGISPDDPESLRRWKAEEKFPYELLSDADHAVADTYGVWGEKKNFGRTYEGIIRSHFVIDEEGRLADVQVNVSPEDSVERGVAALG
ncbi:MAG: thioredoxin-dependent thiol peroxidase [Chloroflexi bacterium]|jgi:peroxiredoxin Q/BCP|nr:thioredoxin-dependent thiol peroxidase [Chloroflexota bacterium]